MIIIYLALLSGGLYWVSKNLLPEMFKPVLPRTENQEKINTSFDIESTDLESRVQKLEFLLAEKNKNINLLQKELKIFQIQVRDSDKIKNILEQEILRLREQNRIFRSELGLPNLSINENSTQLFL